MTVRNRAAVARSQALRGAIRALLEAHPPLLPPLTARAVCRLLGDALCPSERTVQWHMRAIRLETLATDSNSLRSPQFNV